MIDQPPTDTQGWVRQGGTYFIYANANDAAGSTGTHVVSTVTANVANVTTGMTGGGRSRRPGRSRWAA